MLPDVFFHEAAGRNPKNEGPIFDKWGSAHADRIWLGRIWTGLSTMETAPDRLVSQQQITHRPLTEQFRDSLKSGGLLWQNCVRSSDADERISTFVATCQQFAKWACLQHPAWCNELQTEVARHKWVRRPEQVAEMVRVQNERFRDPTWNNTMLGFPDKLAVCRMARLVVWYALCYSLNKTRGFENNWEDAEYAFSASYVGRLATADRGLAEAVKAVFPDVMIIDSPSR